MGGGDTGGGETTVDAADPDALREQAEREYDDPTAAEEKWMAAAEAYDKVATDPATPADEQKRAMEESVNAWTQVFLANPGGHFKESLDDDAPPPPRDARKAQAGAAFLRYADLLGAGDPKHLDYRFQAGQAYWRANDPDQVVVVLGAFVREHPDHELAEAAANVLLDALNRAQRFDEMIAWADEMRANPALMNGRDELKMTLGQLRRASLWKRAQEAERSEDWKGCADTYQTLRKEDPKDPQSDVILYNTMLCLHQAGDTATIKKLLKEMSKAHPDSDWTRQAKEQWGK